MTRLPWRSRTRGSANQALDVAAEGNIKVSIGSGTLPDGTSLRDLIASQEEKAQRQWGDRLPHGWIVRFLSPTTVFEEALAAGSKRGMEFFADMLGGLREGHARELREAGFFEAVRSETGRNVDVGYFEEIKAADMPSLIWIVDSTSPRVSEGVQHLLADLRDMAVRARATNCSIGFML